MTKKKIMSVRTSMNILNLKSKSSNSISVSTDGRSLDDWIKSNPLIIAEEIYFESRIIEMGRLNFLLLVMQYCLGLGNMWRFPIICLQNGGGSFLVIYVLANILIGLPLLFLELFLSQFTSKGVAGCWYFAPGFRGIGYSMILVNLICCLYYSLVLGWFLFYIINSMRFVLPFLTCNNPWNDFKCIPAIDGSTNISNGEFSTEQFWLRFMTTMVSFDGKFIYDIDDLPEKIIWYSSSCMVITWSISAVRIVRGAKIAEKFHVIFVIITFLFMLGISFYSLQLPGSFQGFLLFIVPNYDTMRKFNTWYYAVEQVFFSLGIGFGGMLTIGSNNNFHRNIQNYSFIVCLLNVITSAISGLTLFLTIGYVVHKYSLNPKEISELANHGLIFIAYPECFANFIYPQITTFVFFLMVFILGIDSMFVMIQAVVIGFEDIFPVIEETKYHRICFILLLHCACAILSVILVTNVGYSWFTLIEKYCISLSLLIIGFTEVSIVNYIYSLKNLSRDYKMMMSHHPNFIWKLLLYFISPIILLILIISSIFHWERTGFRYRFYHKIFPLWADILGWVVLCTTILPIIGYFIKFICEKMKSESLPLRKSFYVAVSPNEMWGPSKKRKWLLHEFYKEKLRALRRKSDYYDYKSMTDRHCNLLSKWLELSQSPCWEDYYSEKYISTMSESKTKSKDQKLSKKSKDNLNKDDPASLSEDAEFV